MRPNIFNRAGRASALPAILIFLMMLCATCCAGAEATDPVTVCILDSGCDGHDGAGESFLGDALTDDVDHGTHICALIREAAPEANVVMLKCFDEQQTANEQAIVDALYAAVDAWHADVINMSWTLPNESEALYAAIRHAYDSGAVLVASAGNLSLTTGFGAVVYPAAWDGVIGVAGVDLTDAGEPKPDIWYLYGAAVDFCARGDLGGEKGASFATARVSGLIAAALQGGVDAAQISEHLASQSRDMGDPGFDDRYGWGYLPTP